MNKVINYHQLIRPDFIEYFVSLTFSTRQQEPEVFMEKFKSPNRQQNLSFHSAQIKPPESFALFVKMFVVPVLINEPEVASDSSLEASTGSEPNSWTQNRGSQLGPGPTWTEPRPHQGARDELTWSATSSARLIRSPCPISTGQKALRCGESAERRFESRSGVTMMTRRRLLRPTILRAQRERAPLWPGGDAHATWTHQHE